ncbi:unnamed protein product, partial [Rhizoctonia solani]
MSHRTLTKSNPPTGELPRLTWCTAGKLGHLPLHAAGYYDRPNSKVSDFVVSSYIPSLGALLSTDASTPASCSHSHILAVASENAEGHRFNLQHTKSELDTIYYHANRPIVISRMVDSEARCESVLAGMKASDWLHFAGPIQVEHANPVKSHFQLEDGRLNFDTIIQKSFKNKGLAFLSACGGIVGNTVYRDIGGTLLNMGGEHRLADEAMHLGSAMLMAGYQSVIATTGIAMDDNCPTIADKVYELLLKDGTMDCRNSARALHEAVKCLR